MDTLGQLSIENGRKFENLLQVVDHYSRTPDGLLRSLGDVCPVRNFSDLKSESRVRHGPLRIDDSEISVKGELGKDWVCVGGERGGVPEWWEEGWAPELWERGEEWGTRIGGVGGGGEGERAGSESLYIDLLLYYVCLQVLAPSVQ